MRAPAVVVGNSIGSQVACVCAHAAPELVSGLVLLNCAAGMNQRGLYDDDPTLRLLKPVFVLIELLLKSQLAPALFNSFRTKSNVEKILRQQVYINPQRVTPELIDILYVPSCDEGALGCFVRVFTGDPGPRPDVLASELACPVLVLWGANDRWTPVDGTVARVFARLAQERPEQMSFIVLEACGHVPFDDATDVTVSAALPFLRRSTDGKA